MRRSQGQLRPIPCHGLEFFRFRFIFKKVAVRAEVAIITKKKKNFAGETKRKTTPGFNVRLRLVKY